MYTTFVGTSSGASESNAATDAPQAAKPRQKRSQVARACDWCRMHRIKCDNNLPCSNCRKRKGQCNQGVIEVRTLPHAYRKIEQLETRIKELEQALQEERKTQKPDIGLDTPHTTPSSLASSRSSRPGSSSGNGSNTDKKRLREGIHIRTARSQQETWYGPSSLFYFIRRVNTFLNVSLRQTYSINRMLPVTSNKLFDGPTQSTSKEQGHRPTPPTGGDPATTGDYLTPTQEEYFISLFWQSFHTSLPVLDEVAFKEHYQSLWTAPGSERKPSALVDIVIALSMQHGMSLQAGSGHAGNSTTCPNMDNIDATIAGRWHYQRCQRLLTNELESPTILTLQCHILCTVYLCWGSFQNMSDSTCTLAVRTAYMLGLHLEPPEEMPQREREMRKRLWWALYISDSKISMKLGRPFLLDHSDTTCSLPGDDRENAVLSGSVFAPLGDDATWLTFNLQTIKLFLTVRTAYTAFYKKQLGTNSVFDDQPSDDGSNIIESHAEYLGSFAGKLDHWIKGVPDALKTKRCDHSVPFSTDFSSLDIEQFAPLWLQRQRLLLELMYHNLCINLFRPFIRFAPTSTAPTPLADKTAAKCAAHAIALTRMMHQVLTSTSILIGWHEAFQWQWNATMSLIGFVIAYPQHPSAPKARDSIDLSVTVFDVFGRSLTTAASAAAIARDLGAKADMLTKQSPGKPDSPQGVEGVPQAASTWGASDDETVTNSSGTAPRTPADTWGFGDETIMPMQGMFADPMDMAFSVDTQDFGLLMWPNMNMNMNNDFANQWTFPQQPL
ncbi:fungal-specific transcription factor domain-containing protein [Hypoxylon fragiforme]|uniref:fungal-specific transcription factor domain-containing protein n=1 Tax=Hypoxylon fragiforme TaxID=63214 RepID=UPI0020C6764B|nr:fungal-specific transcription factor domain-containing protein [Hypoxylon fragiforme]KAI2610638.1 fungal-specific transcription factor domain-containing protein [Hypoxylon fragiforme]